MASYAGPNLAMTTSTRIETAAKHHQQVRVNYELMLSWVGFDQMTLRRDKHKYAMHKDDVVIGCARPLRNNEPPRHTARNRAYPSVVATLAKMELPAINYLVALYHNTRTFRDRDEFINNVECNMDAWCGPGSTELARKQILLHGGKQFVEGDVLKWWHEAPSGGVGIGEKTQVLRQLKLAL